MPRQKHSFHSLIIQTVHVFVSEYIRETVRSCKVNSNEGISLFIDTSKHVFEFPKPLQIDSMNAHVGSRLMIL